MEADVEASNFLYSLIALYKNWFYENVDKNTRFDFGEQIKCKKNKKKKKESDDIFKIRNIR